LGPLQRQGRRGLSTKQHVSARAGARGRVVRGSVLLSAVDLRPAPLQIARRNLVEPPAQSWLPPGAPLAPDRPLRHRQSSGDLRVSSVSWQKRVIQTADSWAVFCWAITLILTETSHDAPTDEIGLCLNVTDCAVSGRSPRTIQK
jgi:hypothetical protein